MGGQKRWSAAQAGWLAVLAAVGCSDRHLPSKPAPEGAFEDGGGTTLGGDGDGDGDGYEPRDTSGDPPWLFDGMDLRLTCPVAQHLEAGLSRSCPEAVAGESCDVPEEPCTHYEPGIADIPLLVCTMRCSHAGLSPYWIGGCSDDCRQACPEPPVGATIVTLETSDCMSRPLAPCLRDGMTLQNQLDAQLQSELIEVYSSGEINEQSLTVHFEGGCATRVVLPSERSLPVLEPILREALGSLRLSCAVELGCGTMFGAMTLP